MNRTPRLDRAGAIIAAVLASVAGGAAQQAEPTPRPPAEQEPSSPGAVASQPATQLDPVVDRILTRLEDRKVRDLRAKVKWELEYVVEEGTDVKLGRIWYQDADPVPRFKVHFTTKISGNRKDDDYDNVHVFDGLWYTEVQNQNKTITRRQIRRPDDDYNPYKLGEGTFPIPFGQEKRDILREFEVRRLEPEAKAPPGTDRLELTPRPGSTMAEDYRKIEFYVAREGRYAGLPIKLRAYRLDPTGALNNVITITFSDIELDAGFSATVFDVEKPAGYEEIVEPLGPRPSLEPPARP